MSKLLLTRLPLALGETVSVDTFNRLIRILELNLGSVDPDLVKSYNATELSELQFATGAIIFNSTTEVHQAFGLEGDDEIVGFLYLGTPGCTPMKVPERDLSQFVEFL